jgi:hypothetical protein
MTSQSAVSHRWYQSAVFWAALVTAIFLGGAFVGSSVAFRKVPKDRAEAMQQITVLQHSVDAIFSQLKGEIEKNNDLQKQLKTASEEIALARHDASEARQEADEAKSAEPDRFKVVKDGVRTWRLDTATGKLCLLLTSDEDWKIPSMARQSCSLQ